MLLCKLLAFAEALADWHLVHVRQFSAVELAIVAMPVVVTPDAVGVVTTARKCRIPAADRKSQPLKITIPKPIKICATTANVFAAIYWA